MTEQPQVQPQAQPQAQQQPVPPPFSVVLHYDPATDRTMIVPIGINLPVSVFLHILDLARTIAIRAELREQERAAAEAATAAGAE
jgi:hypothetical protein